MNRTLIPTLTLLVMALTAVGLATPPPAQMGGWENQSAYNRLYKPAELDRIKVVVEKIEEIVPVVGMAPATALVVKEDDTTTPIIVHICPAWYMKGADTGIKKGDELKIRGAWAEIGGKDEFMAAKIKKGEHFSLKVRLTKDGTPFWTMTPEQQAQEKEAD